MKTLKNWMEAQLAEHKAEPNSGLGKDIQYMLRHWEAVDAVPSLTGRTSGQQSRREGAEEGDLAPEKLAVLQDDEGS